MLAAAYRIHQTHKLGLRFTFVAFEADVLGHAAASARIGADVVFQPMSARRGDGYALSSSFLLPLSALPA